VHVSYRGKIIKATQPSNLAQVLPHEIMPHAKNLQSKKIEVKMMKSTYPSLSKSTKVTDEH